MEEDIKILEELIKEYEKLGNTIKEVRISQVLFERLIQAIQNLIARYKVLEKINNKYKVVKTLNEIQEYKLELDYIPKSKVQEKIEDLEKRGYFEEANAMQDLLEES